MYIVTGGAGFIGSNIIKLLNQIGCNDILVVDDIHDGKKLKNLFSLKIYDLISIDDFYEKFLNSENTSLQISTVFHNGACSDTTNWDGAFVMKQNFEASKDLLHWCQKNSYQFIYASSASVYGSGKNGFSEIPKNERALNPYAYSKLLFDNYVRTNQEKLLSQVVGLRYFNVYGPNEAHKASMASVILHMHEQMMNTNTIKLFEGSDGYGDGEQRRDFIYVEDVAKVNIWFSENQETSGLFNLGTGLSWSFNNVAEYVIEWHQRKYKNFNTDIKYIDFPEKLKGTYQSFTQADITNLRKAGYTEKFNNLKDGIFNYLDTISVDQ